MSGVSETRQWRVSAANAAPVARPGDRPPHPLLQGGFSTLLENPPEDICRTKIEVRGLYTLIFVLQISSGVRGAEGPRVSQPALPSPRREARGVGGWERASRRRARRDDTPLPPIA